MSSGLFWGIAYGVLGLVSGPLLLRYAQSLIAVERRIMQMPPSPLLQRRLAPLTIGLVAAALFGGLAFAVFHGQVQHTAEVQPSGLGLQFRVGYHVLLIALLIVATIVDLDCYMIPDWITGPGACLGIGLAVAWPELQLIHLWVDWNQEIPGLRGPWFPEWFDQHRRWHALGWSLCGAATGAASTALIRMLSGKILGQEAFGMGDVTLMAMVGSFIGWQPTLCVMLIAPLTGLVQAVGLRLVLNRLIVPYGPCLAAATVIVLFTWGSLWRATRTLFGDWLGMLIVGGAALGMFLVLLTLLRLWKRGRKLADLT